MLRRWKAVATYRTDNGPVTFTHHFDEIEELHNLVEAGPDWTTLDKIEIRYDGHFIEERPPTRPRLIKN